MKLAILGLLFWPAVMLALAPVAAGQVDAVPKHKTGTLLPDTARPTEDPTCIESEYTAEGCPPGPEAPAITGAFGYTLGDPFTPAPGAEVARNETGDVITVTPPVPFRAFRVYAVSVTPRSGRIFRVSALTKLPTEARCETEWRFVAERLRDKYGDMRPGRAEGLISSQSFWIDAERRWIVLQCNYRTLFIMYTDPALLEQGRAEIAEIRAQADDSGL